MIIARASIVAEDGEQVYYVYGSVLIPQGMLHPEAVYFFNRENIEKIIFEGYKNKDEEQFSESYDEMISRAKIHKGNVNNKESENFGFE